MLEELAADNKSAENSNSNINNSDASTPPHPQLTKSIECDAEGRIDDERQHQGHQQSSSADDLHHHKHQQPYDLAHFIPSRILNNNSTHKSVSLVGRFTNLSPDDYAIVALEKKAFTEGQLLLVPSSSSAPPTVVTKAENSDGLCSPTLPKTESSCNKSTSESETAAVEASRRHSFFSSSSRLRTEFINDIYGNFQCVVDPEINQLKATIIYPANEKLIVKYSAQEKYLIEETAHDYQTVTVPHLEQEQLSLEWLYNVLEHRKEKDRIVFEDPSDEIGFILLPDLKWDGKTLEQLYLLALVRPRGIKSLRDLTAVHLPLLRNIRDKGIAAIKKRYGFGADRLRIYLHYQPTFYHLHVHFTYLKHDPPGIQCEKSHLLGTVISNLELLPDYYQKATLACVLKETDKLYEKFKAARNGNDDPPIKRVKLTE